MKQLTTTILLLVISAITALAQSEECPVKITRFRVNGGFDTRSQYALLYMENNSERAIESVEYQFEEFDYERQRSRGRYYLAVGKMTASPGKPIQPGQTKPLQGGVSSRFGILYGGRLSDGEEIKINVIHFTDGSKWERKGWREKP